MNMELLRREETTMHPTTGLQAITAERQRQIEDEGFLPNHDDEHRNGELAQAASAYAYPEGEGVTLLFQDLRGGVLFPASWSSSWWKPVQGEYLSGRKRELEKAGALIAAEWDRIERLEKTLHSFVGQDKETLSWIDWCERLQEYSYVLGHERELVIGCGEECWKGLYEEGLDIPEAFRVGFEE